MVRRSDYGEVHDVTYSDDGCCLHSCLARECPEPICFLDFQTEKPTWNQKTWDRFKEICNLQQSGMDSVQIAQKLGIRKSKVEDLLKIKDKLVLT